MVVNFKELNIINGWLVKYIDGFQTVDENGVKVKNVFRDAAIKHLEVYDNITFNTMGVMAQQELTKEEQDEYQLEIPDELLEVTSTYMNIERILKNF